MVGPKTLHREAKPTLGTHFFETQLFLQNSVIFLRNLIIFLQNLIIFKTGIQVEVSRFLSRNESGNCSYAVDVPLVLAYPAHARLHCHYHFTNSLGPLDSSYKIIMLLQSRIRLWHAVTLLTASTHLAQ